MLIIDDYTVTGTLSADCDETTFRSQLTTLSRPECAKNVVTHVQSKQGTFSIKLVVGEPDEALNELDEYMSHVRRLDAVADCDGDFRDHDVITEEERAQAAAMGAGMQNFNDMMDLEEQAAQPVAVASGPKVSRNAPCLCGSGKKYKKCCGAVA